jgi:hypothetical protein
LDGADTFKVTEPHTAENEHVAKTRNSARKEQYDSEGRYCLFENIGLSHR